MGKHLLIEIPKVIATLCVTDCKALDIEIAASALNPIPCSANDAIYNTMRS